MPYQDFRQFLDVLRQHGELVDIDRPVALSDVGKVMKQSYRRQGPGIVFNNNGTAFPLVAGVYSTRSKALLAFEADEKTILQKVLSGLDHPIAPEVSAAAAPCHDVLIAGEAIDLARFPIPTYSPKDGGPYITPGIVVSKDPETGVPDIDHYRFLVLGRADRPDWFLSVRPEIKSVADLKGKFVATAALQVGETWLTADWLSGQGLKPQDFGFLVVGTSALKFAALQRGSVAAAIMFQPLAMEAQLGGYSTIHRFLEGRPFPPVLYVVNRQWAAQKERGQRLSRAIVQAHKWLLDPANRSEAIAILQKYTKRETAVMEAVYDLFIAKDKLYTADAAVDSAGVDTEIATMIEKGVLPAGTVMRPQDYMLPRELGGLYR
jgi:hypothetical protein